MKHNINFGYSVRIQFVSGEDITLRNVTEIHYNYDSPAIKVMGPQVAFESSIHTTGCTYRITEVKEFETRLENSEADWFAAPAVLEDKGTHMDSERSEGTLQSAVGDAYERQIKAMNSEQVEKDLQS